MRRSLNDKSSVRVTRTEHTSAPIFNIRDNIEPKWHPTTQQGEGLPTVAGVYRFRVPRENFPDETIEFLAMLRWRRHGVRHILFPSFEYFVDDEFITIPEGTMWAYPERDDPKLLADGKFPIVQSVADSALRCPFCRKLPQLAGHKVDLETGDIFTTSHPYRFNRLWFTCCEWIAPAPRESLTRLIIDWNTR